MIRFPAPAHVQSSTCSRPSASRNRVGRLWLSGIARERELRALECQSPPSMSRTSSEVAVSATTASIRPVTSASAPSSTNGASVDGVIEPTRRMARAGSRVAGSALDVPLGKRVCEHGGRHSAGRGDGRTLPCGACLAKFEHAVLERSLQIDVGGRWNVAEAAGCRRERDVGAYLGRLRTARDSHLEIDGAGRIEGVWSRHSNERHEIGDGACQRDVQRLTCSRPSRQPASRHERRVADPQLQIVGDHSITRVAQPGRAHETYGCAID